MYRCRLNHNRVRTYDYWEYTYYYYYYYRVNWLALFGCRELNNIGRGFIGGGFVAIARWSRNHVARLEYGYGTIWIHIVIVSVGWQNGWNEASETTIQKDYKDVLRPVVSVTYPYHTKHPWHPHPSIFYKTSLL